MLIKQRVTHLLEKTLRMNYLFDFYHELLTPKQKEYLKLYYLEDYALVEIAKKANVSRQAVYDNIKRSESILEEYEQKLQMYAKFQKRTKLLNQLQKLFTNHKDQEKGLQIIKELQKIS